MTKLISKTRLIRKPRQVLSFGQYVFENGCKKGVFDSRKWKVCGHKVGTTLLDLRSRKLSNIRKRVRLVLIKYLTHLFFFFFLPPFHQFHNTRNLAIWTRKTRKGLRRNKLHKAECVLLYKDWKAMPILRKTWKSIKKCDAIL